MVWSALAHLFTVLLALIGNHRRSVQEKELELLILQHQLNILLRKQKTPIKATQTEKLTLAVLTALLKARTRRPPRQLGNLIRLFHLETVLKWHRELVRRKWTYTRKNNGGRPRIEPEIEALIVQLATENSRWVMGKFKANYANWASALSKPRFGRPMPMPSPKDGYAPFEPSAWTTCCSSAVRIYGVC